MYHSHYAKGASIISVYRRYLRNFYVRGLYNYNRSRNYYFQNLCVCLSVLFVRTSRLNYCSKLDTIFTKICYMLHLDTPTRNRVNYIYIQSVVNWVSTGGKSRVKASNP